MTRPAVGFSWVQNYLFTDGSKKSGCGREVFRQRKVDGSGSVREVRCCDGEIRAGWNYYGKMERRWEKDGEEKEEKGKERKERERIMI
jgi:hypothetical protein